MAIAFAPIAIPPRVLEMARKLYNHDRNHQRVGFHPILFDDLKQPDKDRYIEDAKDWLNTYGEDI